MRAIKSLLRDHDWEMVSQPTALEGAEGYSEVRLRCTICGEDREPLIGCGLTVDRPELLPGCVRAFRGRYEVGDQVVIPSRSGGEQLAYFDGYRRGDLIHVRPGGSDPPLDLPSDQVRPALGAKT